MSETYGLKLCLSHTNSTTIGLDTKVSTIPHRVFRVGTTACGSFLEDLSPFLLASITDRSSIKGDTEIRRASEIDRITTAASEGSFWCDEFRANEHYSDKQAS